MKKILVVEDDFDIRELIESFLENEGFEVKSACDGVEACSMFLEDTYDLIILDVMIPKIDGFVVCEFIRKKSQLPIVMLTALSSEENQLKGFDLQIDDYITKPFSPVVLARRISAILRRIPTEVTPQNINYKELTLDLQSYQTYISNIYVELTSKEFEILRELLLHQGIILSRSKLLAMLWEDDFDVDEQIINTHIKNIRKKLGIDYIKTVRGVGYRIDKL